MLVTRKDIANFWRHHIDGRFAFVNSLVNAEERSDRLLWCDVASLGKFVDDVDALSTCAVHMFLAAGNLL